MFKDDTMDASRRAMLAGSVGVAAAAVAVTSAPGDGWGSATVIAPLVISVALTGGFLFYETRIPEEWAAL